MGTTDEENLTEEQLQERDRQCEELAVEARRLTPDATEEEIREAVIARYLHLNMTEEERQPACTMQELFAELEVMEVEKMEEQPSAAADDRRIECAAIRTLDGRVWTGRRHNDCVAEIAKASGVTSVAGERGFVTCAGRFVSRAEARIIAVAAGQVRDLAACDPVELTSQDLY